MNARLHRVIFNKARGLLMAVAETASAVAGGHPRSRHAPVARLCVSPRAVALAAWACAGAITGHAQIIADPTAPAGQRPTVLMDAAGRPLVNIQTPSAGGVSRNTYSQFDVQSNGVTLNNSRHTNPWLATGEARVILNEVNSSGPSYLRGAITVLGSRAQVIVANPSGIQIDGASFINASRATLTTGTPEFQDGELKSLRVQRGAVTVQAGGLNVKGVEYTEILSRAATIAGAIEADPSATLSLVTGTQSIDFATGEIVKAVEGIGNRPALAIDSSSLGGMYAGKISLLATEAGVGVRHAGTINAGSQLVVTADGRLENTGQMKAGVLSVGTFAGDIDNVGHMHADTLLSIRSGGDLRHAGMGLAQKGTSGPVVLAYAGRDLLIEGGAGITSTSVGGQVLLSAGRDIHMRAASNVAAHETARLSADGYLVSQDARISSASADVTLLSGQGMHLTNTYVTGQHLHLETGAPFKQTGANIDVAGGGLDSRGSLTAMATGSIWLGTKGFGRLHASGDMHLQAGRDVTLVSGTKATALQDLTISAGEQLGLWDTFDPANLLRADSVQVEGDIRLSAGRAMLSGVQVRAGGDLTLETHSGDAMLYASEDGEWDADSRANLSAQGDLNVSAYNGSLWMKGVGIDGRNVSLLSNGVTSLSHLSSTDPNSPGLLESYVFAQKDLTFGSVHNSANVQVSASYLDAGGHIRVLGQGDVLLYADDSPAWYGGARLSLYPAAVRGGQVDIRGGSVFTRGAVVHATSGNVSVQSTEGNIHLGSQNGRRTDIKASGSLALHANRTLDLWYANADAGASLAGTSALGDIKSNGSILIAKDILSLNAKGSQFHTNAFVDGGALAVQAQQGSVTLSSTRLQTRQTQAPELQSISGQLSVESDMGMTVDAASVLSATTDLSIVAGQGDITLTPSGLTSTSPGLVLSQSQLGIGRGFTLAARNGKLSLTGEQGYQGFGSSRRVDLNLAGNIQLIGNAVSLAGTKLRTIGRVDVTATTGQLNIQAIKTTADEYRNINTYWDRAEIAASQGIDLRALGDVQIHGLWAHTWGQANVLAGGNATITGNYNEWQYESPPDYSSLSLTQLWTYFASGQTSSIPGAINIQQHYLNPTEISAATGVTVAALGGHLALNGTNISAGNGTARLQALGDVTLEAAYEHYLYQSNVTQKKTSWYGKKKTTNTVSHNESLIALPVWLDGQDIEIKAGNNVQTYAAQLSARGNIHIGAGDEANYYAVRDQTYNHTTVSKTSSLWGIKYKSSTLSDTRQITSAQPAVLQSTGSIVSLSGGDQTLQGTEAIYGGTATFAPGVGEKARDDAKIILQGVIESVSHARTFESDSVVWMKQAGEGGVQETLKLPSFHGPSTPVFKGPLLVDIPAGDFTAQITRLSQQPGMGYLNDLSQRSDVNWRPVQLAFDQWKYEQEGLTGAGAALVAVAVAWATSGMGAELLGTTTPLTGAMADAAFMSLSSQAAISFINNKGDIGKTLKDLASSDVAKATLAAALTAGVLDKLGGIPGMEELKKSASWSDKLTYNLINAGGRALTTAAIEGGDLEDALRGAVLGGLIDTVHGSVAGHIKGLEANYLAHKLAHALAGCVAGAAAGGECRDGAIGAAVGEVVAGLFKDQKPSIYASDAEKDAYSAKVLAYSKIVAGGVAAYAGGSAQTAIATAETAVRHNFLTFDENQLRKQAIDQCKAGNAQACADEQRWKALDTNRDDKVREVCGGAPDSQACADWRAFAVFARDSYDKQVWGSGSVTDLLRYRDASDARELQSIQQLIATTPYAYNVTASPHLRTLASIAADLTPIVGDIKAFHEARDPFDYALAMVGALGPVGDGAAAALRAAKAAHEAGDAAQVSANLGKASAEARDAVQARFGLSFDPNTRTWTSPAGLDYGPGSIHGNRVKHVLDHTVPNASKPVHSVFNVSRADVLKLVDEAWVKKGQPLLDDPGVYVVDMGRVVGTEGQTSIRLVVRPQTNKLLTAHPY